MALRSTEAHREWPRRARGGGEMVANSFLREVEPERVGAELAM
jgi:hypothetical protein